MKPSPPHPQYHTFLVFLNLKNDPLYFANFWRFFVIFTNLTNLIKFGKMVLSLPFYSKLRYWISVCNLGCLIDQTNESSEQVAFILCATRSDDISDF